MATTKPRQQRVPVSGPRNILTVANKDPNYVYRWVLDVPGRLETFKRGGYEIVEDNNEVGDPAVDRHKQLGSAITMVKGSATLVLMRILREWFDEDQKAKQDSIDDLEQTMISSGAGDYGKVEINSRK